MNQTTSWSLTRIAQTTHFAATRALRRLKGSDTIPQQDSNGNLAVKLLRTFAAQTEALQRYRGKGQQNITVEHVHVAPGGRPSLARCANPEGGGIMTKTEDNPMHLQPRSSRPCTRTGAFPPELKLPFTTTAANGRDGRRQIPYPCRHCEEIRFGYLIEGQDGCRSDAHTKRTLRRHLAAPSRSRRRAVTSRALR
jgi:hypothetical protein